MRLVGRFVGKLMLIGGYREIVGEYGARPLYSLLGYFSLVGLLRVHVLLGDFTLALKVMDNVALQTKVCSSFTLCLLDAEFFNLPDGLHPCHGVPRRDLLLRQLLLHDAPSLP